MKPELIVIASATKARLISRASEAEPLVALETLEAADAHSRPSDTGADRPGHGSHDSHRAGVSFAPRMDPRRKRQLAFAEQLSQRIDEMLSSGHGHLSVFSACPFLGALKSRLSPSARKALRHCVDSDLTHLDLGEIERRVDALSHAHGLPATAGRGPG